VRRYEWREWRTCGVDNEDSVKHGISMKRLEDFTCDANLLQVLGSTPLEKRFAGYWTEGVSVVVPESLPSLRGLYVPR